MSSGSDLKYTTFVAKPATQITRSGGVVRFGRVSVGFVKERSVSESDLYFSCLGTSTVNPAKPGVECGLLL